MAMCINEVKSAVDGTPILRKVSFVFFWIFQQWTFLFILITFWRTNSHSIEHSTRFIRIATYFALRWCLLLIYRPKTGKNGSWFMWSSNTIVWLKSAHSISRTDFACICFGQTGSGKTHTLFGNAQIDGLCVLTAEHLLKTNERLFCGFYEIYNGQLFDLINQSNKYLPKHSNLCLNSTCF
jgi:hypothetical protein